jgi:hypothetical protein
MLTLHGAAALVNNKSQRPAGGGGGGTGQRRAFDCKAALAMNYSPRADKTRPAASAGEARRGAARRGPQTGARRGVRPPFDYSRGCARPGPARPGPQHFGGIALGAREKLGLIRGRSPRPHKSVLPDSGAGSNYSPARQGWRSAREGMAVRARAHVCEVCARVRAREHLCNAFVCARLRGARVCWFNVNIVTFVCVHVVSLCAQVRG